VRAPRLIVRSPLFATLLACGPVFAVGSMTATMAGCASTSMHVASLDEVERVRITDETRDSAVKAPEAYARAEQERGLARAAHAAGDDVAANLHAQRAIAAYGHAEAVARLARAIGDLADAQKALDDATAGEQSLEASRAKLDLDAQELERRAQLVRGQLLPAASGAAAADREAARLAAAKSLATEARLLCGAARLVGSTAPASAPAGLTDAQDEVDKLDARLGKAPSPGSAKGAPPAEPHAPHAEPHAGVIDDAGLARAHCLDALTRARRSAGPGPGDVGADALLSELSASGGWDPVRDERGVVVTLRGAFQGTQLTPDGQTKLANLGRVAASHPGFVVQVVVHDAVAPAARDEGDARRADATVKALVTAGASAPRVKAELAGALAPAVDPTDARLRARNERIDVVFVGG
jgi:outer membrane protein OmpA-like peptidoglycan-associated protein